MKTKTKPAKGNTNKNKTPREVKNAYIAGVMDAIVAPWHSGDLRTDALGTILGDGGLVKPKDAIAYLTRLRDNGIVDALIADGRSAHIVDEKKARAGLPGILFDDEEGLLTPDEAMEYLDPYDDGIACNIGGLIYEIRRFQGVV